MFLPLVFTSYLLFISVCENVSGYRYRSGTVRRTKNRKPDYKISMVASEDNVTVPALFRHAESPVWDDETQSLYFVDVLEQNVHRLNYETGQIFTKHIGYGQVNVVALVCGSRRLLVAVRAGLYLLDWDVEGDAALRLLTTVDDGLPDNVINEGKVDAAGRFWAGTKGPQNGDYVVPDKASFFSFEQATLPTARLQLRPVTISNGVAWALNNTVMYYIDSPTQTISAFDFDLTSGKISNQRTIFNISDHGYQEAIPDGMTIDTKGHLWVAAMFGGAVLQIDPDSRRLVYAYELPTKRITSVCWGGPRRDELFVTSSRDGTLGGALFVIRDTGRRGQLTDRFQFTGADTY